MTMESDVQAGKPGERERLSMRRSRGELEQALRELEEKFHAAQELYMAVRPVLVAALNMADADVRGLSDLDMAEYWSDLHRAVRKYRKWSGETPGGTGGEAVAETGDNGPDGDSLGRRGI